MKNNSKVVVLVHVDVSWEDIFHSPPPFLPTPLPFTTTYIDILRLPFGTVGF